MKRELEFKQLRNQIEEIDERIFSLFGERVSIVKEIAKIKKENEFPLKTLKEKQN